MSYWIILDYHRPVRPGIAPILVIPRYQIQRIEGVFYAVEMVERRIEQVAVFFNATPLPGYWMSENLAQKECTLLEAVARVMDS